jgi:hypothetical protein
MLIRHPRCVAQFRGLLGLLGKETLHTTELKIDQEFIKGSGKWKGDPPLELSLGGFLN